MELLTGKCITCEDCNHLLAQKDVNVYFKQLNKVENVQKKDLNKYKTNSRSLCVICAYSIDCCINNVEKMKSIKKKKVGQGRTCSICCATGTTKQLLKCTLNLVQQTKTYLKNMEQKVKFDIKHLCMDCCFCVTVWHKISNALLLSTTVPPTQQVTDTSDNETVENQIKYAPRPKRNLRSIKVKEMETTNNRKLLKKTKQMNATQRTGPESESEDDEEEEEKSSKKRRRISSTDKRISEFDCLKYLVSVDKKTRLKTVSVSPQVKKDERMMSQLPYVNCGTSHLETLITRKATASTSKAVNNSSTEPRYNTRKRVSTKTIAVPVLAKKQKMLRSAKKPTITTNKRVLFECNECGESFRTNYKFKLHKLEHKSSYSPKVVIIQTRKSTDDNDESTASHSSGESENQSQSDDDMSVVRSDESTTITKEAEDTDEAEVTVSTAIETDSSQDVQNSSTNDDDSSSVAVQDDNKLVELEVNDNEIETDTNIAASSDVEDEVQTETNPATKDSSDVEDEVQTDTNPATKTSSDVEDEVQTVTNPATKATSDVEDEVQTDTNPATNDVEDKEIQSEPNTTTVAIESNNDVETVESESKTVVTNDLEPSEVLSPAIDVTSDSSESDLNKNVEENDRIESDLQPVSQKSDSIGFEATDLTNNLTIDVELHEETIGNDQSDSTNADNVEQNEEILEKLDEKSNEKPTDDDDNCTPDKEIEVTEETEQEQLLEIEDSNDKLSDISDEKQTEEIENHVNEDENHVNEDEAEIVQPEENTHEKKDNGTSNVVKTIAPESEEYCTYEKKESPDKTISSDLETLLEHLGA